MVQTLAHAGDPSKRRRAPSAKMIVAGGPRGRRTGLGAGDRNRENRSKWRRQLAEGITSRDPTTSSSTASCGSRFNEEDFSQRVEQAAVKLDFVDGGLDADELHDLLELAVNGEIREPGSTLGEHINEHWTELVGPANRSLVHWIRRLVFRGAWLDQRVKEGELDVVFDERQPHLRLRPARSRLQSRSSSRASPPGPGSPTAARARAEGAEQLVAFEDVSSIRSRSSPAASLGVEVGEQRAQAPRRLELVGLAELLLVGDPAFGRDAAPARPRRRRARGRASPASSRS